MRTEEQKHIDHRWQDILYELKGRFGRKPDLQSMLFLIGVQELGQIDRAFSKEEKQDLMHIALCTLLAKRDFYRFDGKDEEGWPHFTQIKDHPSYELKEQEYLLKELIVEYFEEHSTH